MILGHDTDRLIMLRGGIMTLRMNWFFGAIPALSFTTHEDLSRAL